MQHLPSKRAPDNVAARDAAHAASQCAGKSWNGVKVSSIDKKTTAGQQEFIGYRNADDAEHQQPEDGEIAVGCDPLEDGVFQAAMIT